MFNVNFVRFSTLGCSACQRRGANASRRSTGSRRDKGIRRRGLEVLGSRIEAWKNMQMRENKWKIYEVKNAKMRRNAFVILSEVWRSWQPSRLQERSTS